MGVSSSNLSYGVPSNPRVEFASALSKKENKIVRIDVPALVKLPHGTVRYRHKDKPGEKSVEKPYEGTSLAEKYHYFYHQKYTDKAEGEPEWKYCYVYKGPERARQKKIYYVFGKGLKVNDNGFVETKYKPEEQCFKRPIFYKIHGHIYFELIFLNREVQPDDISQGKVEIKHNDLLYDYDEKPSSTNTENKDIELCVPVDKEILDIKVDLARQFVILTAHIHIYLHSAELKNNQKLKDLSATEKVQKHVWILLHAK